MDPIGGSRDWTWYAYDNAIVEVDGQRLPSVPGGTHWGGGLRIHAEDQALVGELVRRGGEWDGRRIVPAEWLAWSLAPCPLNASYGFLWWLNGEGRQAEAPRSSVFAQGAGGNYTWIWPEGEVTAVLRWVDPDALSRFCGMVVAALR
jgi:CubicO group peptidase (beta-lactamase class C family)